MTFPSRIHAGGRDESDARRQNAGESRSSPREIQNYLGRISGPLLDRIDLHIEVPQVKFREITGEQTGETSAQIRERVMAARQTPAEAICGTSPKSPATPAWAAAN